MTLGPKLKWIKSHLPDKVYLVIFFILSFLITLQITKHLETKFLFNTILIIFAFHLFFITIKDFVVKRFNNLSQNISHLGFSLFILSILFNNLFSTEVITNLKVGETFSSDKFNIKFEKLSQKKIENYQSIIGQFTIENSNGIIEIMNPELRIYNQPKISTSEADIKTDFFSDRFITMNIVQNQEYFNVRYQTKPLMIWIWLSTLLIALGGITSFFKKKYES